MKQVKDETINMLYRFASSKASLHTFLPENARYPYVYGTIIPYSSNLREPRGLLKEVERLSFYSSFALNAAIEMYNHWMFQKFVLFSDATFGKERKSTGILMKEALLRAHTSRRIQEADIVLLEASYLNNTPAQIKELAEYLLKNNLRAEVFVLVNWGFHDERIRKYMQGFGIKVDTITVEEAHKYYHPGFQSEKLQQVLPKAFEEREKKLRLLAHLDRRGLIPRLLKRFTGPEVTDIQKIQYLNEFFLDRKEVPLVFENLSGREKLYWLEKKKAPGSL